MFGTSRGYVGREEWEKKRRGRGTYLLVGYDVGGGRLARSFMYQPIISY
jgi:hypothetical protein